MKNNQLLVVLFFVAVTFLFGSTVAFGQIRETEVSTSTTPKTTPKATPKPATTPAKETTCACEKDKNGNTDNDETIRETTVTRNSSNKSSGKGGVIRTKTGDSKNGSSSTNSGNNSGGNSGNNSGSTNNGGGNNKPNTIIVKDPELEKRVDKLEESVSLWNKIFTTIFGDDEPTQKKTAQEFRDGMKELPKIAENTKNVDWMAGFFHNWGKPFIVGVIILMLVIILILLWHALQNMTTNKRLNTANSHLDKMDKDQSSFFKDHLSRFDAWLDKAGIQIGDNIQNPPPGDGKTTK